MSEKRDGHRGDAHFLFKSIKLQPSITFLRIVLIGQLKHVLMFRISLVIISIFSLCLPFNTLATSTPTDSTDKLLRDKTLLALPVVFRFPETGWGGGVAATSTFSFAKDSSWAKESQASLALTYTQLRQIIAYLPFSIFTKNDKYFFSSDLGWYKYNYFYYGIGEDFRPEEVYDVDFLRIKFLASRQINKKTYLGLRLDIEPYKITGVEEGGELATGNIAGSENSRVSALGVAILRDSRDDVFYPTKGVFGEFNVMPSSKVFGADTEFTRISLDAAGYFSPRKKIVLASHVYAMSNIGKEIPFNQLALIGGAKRMRGLYYGFFRDKNAIVLQEELRWEAWRFLGLVGFGGVAVMGNEQDILRLNKPKFTYGAGLRIATKNHLNIRLDYGMSPYGPGNFYATIGEAF